MKTLSFSSSSVTWSAFKPVFLLASVSFLSLARANVYA